MPVEKVKVGCNNSYISDDEIKKLNLDKQLEVHSYNSVYQPGSFYDSFVPEVLLTISANFQNLGMDVISSLIADGLIHLFSIVWKRFKNHPPKMTHFALKHGSTERYLKSDPIEPSIDLVDANGKIVKVVLEREKLLSKTEMLNLFGIANSLDKGKHYILLTDDDRIRIFTELEYGHYCAEKHNSHN